MSNTKPQGDFKKVSLSIFIKSFIPAKQGIVIYRGDDMKKFLKGALCAVLCVAVLISPANICAAGENETDVVLEIGDLAPFDLDCLSAVLMDSATGTVLYEKNPDEALPPASVTKIMTLLLVMEAIDSGKLKLEDKLQASEYGASMGGSQVYLEPGEEMSVDDLLKCVVVSSANDAAVTLAEAVAGTESGFITMMNDRARELGMTSTNFENATGLDDTTVNHVTSARDIAIMSRELMSHPLILQYSSIWMDTVREGAFGLSNTNRLIRFYSGATGLKTGSTSKAKFCISATACRDGLHLIAVIMGAPTRDIRNEAAKTLLDYGFANFSLYTDTGGQGDNVKVLGGVADECPTVYEPFCALMRKGDSSKVVLNIEAAQSIAAPVKEGDVIGKVTYTVGEEVVGETPLLAGQTVEKISFRGLFLRMLGHFSVS